MPIINFYPKKEENRRAYKHACEHVLRDQFMICSSKMMKGNINQCPQCNVPIRPKKKKKRKKERQRLDFFGFPCALPNPTTHHSFFTHPLISLTGSSLLISFLFFFFFHFLYHSSPLPHTLPPVPPCHHLHHHFSSNVIGKSLGTSKHLHLLFEVKVSNLFGEFICFYLMLFFI